LKASEPVIFAENTIATTVIIKILEKEVNAKDYSLEVELRACFEGGK